jgi:hypothetical protein
MVWVPSVRVTAKGETDGGMTAVDLKQGDLEALAAYLRQLR